MPLFNRELCFDGWTELVELEVILSEIPCAFLNTLMLLFLPLFSFVDPVELVVLVGTDEFPCKSFCPGAGRMLLGQSKAKLKVLVG